MINYISVQQSSSLLLHSSFAGLGAASNSTILTTGRTSSDVLVLTLTERTSRLCYFCRPLWRDLMTRNCKVCSHQEPARDRRQQHSDAPCSISAFPVVMGDILESSIARRHLPDTVPATISFCYSFRSCESFLEELLVQHGVTEGDLASEVPNHVGRRTAW